MAGVPANILVPFMGMEFDPSRAAGGPATLQIQTLIIGQKLAAGTGAVNEPHLVSNADEVAVLAGFGSQAHIAAIKFFLNNSSTTTYVMLQEDAATSTAATVGLTVTGTAAANGELVTYINGVRYAVGVLAAEDPTAIAAKIAAAITADVDSPFTASSLAGVVTLTAKNKGITAGLIRVDYNRNSGEVFPTDVSVATGAITPGAVDPDAQDIVDNIGDYWFQFYVGAFDDTTNLDVIETFLNDRFGVLEQKDGMYYFGKKDTRANLITFSTDSARNSQSVSMGAVTDIPQTPIEIMAAYVGQAAASVQDDPSVPLHRLTLQGITPPLRSERWDLIERNQLAVNGIMTFTNDLGVQSESTVTMYLKNSAGASDIAYQFQNTLFNLQRQRFTFNNVIQTKYPRAKLADTIAGKGAGQIIMTPNIGKMEAIAWFKTQEKLGQVENLDQFIADLVVERDTTNVNRLNWLMSPDLMNQFIVGSTINQFQLQAAAT